MAFPVLEVLPLGCSRKGPHSPLGGKFCATRKGREEKFVSDNSKCVKGVGEGE
jgi:ABC-type antimicrobial peptide transport system ATPase subunit